MFADTLIAGPCAAESPEQVLRTAEAIAAQHLPVGQTIYRAGLWKPRSAPNSFQGVGEEGLPWLLRVRQDYGMPVATEVATPEQVRLCMDAGIDYLWIGARTAANPIAVQELADTLHGCLQQSDKRLRGVWVKNPMHEDSRLWEGNIARVQQAVTGTDVAVWAVHRGCNHRPCWDMAYQLHKNLPDIPLLLDASHMAGDAGLIAELLAQGAALHYNGCMLETHIHPQQALSDAQQQITPTQLAEIWNHIPLPDGRQPLDLRWLRAMMDETDDDLCAMINRRMTVSRRIGELKRRLNIPVVQPERFRQVLEQRKARGRQYNISEQCIESVYEALHQESIRKQ